MVQQTPDQRPGSAKKGLGLHDNQRVYPLVYGLYLGIRSLRLRIFSQTNKPAPPLICYLAAGFGLQTLGVEPEASLESLGDLGVTLLLFTIGLKLNINSLLKMEIWGGAAGHMGTIVLLTIINSLVFAALGITYFVGLDFSGAALIGFVVSFSSTVCAVKVLEVNVEMRARHGQVAIGILIIQDIAAVIFVTLATDNSPSWWALALLGLPLIRPLLHHFLERCGHGEILPLAGIFLAFTGGELFENWGLFTNAFGSTECNPLLSSDLLLRV